MKSKSTTTTETQQSMPTDDPSTQTGTTGTTGSTSTEVETETTTEGYAPQPGAYGGGPVYTTPPPTTTTTTTTTDYVVSDAERERAGRRVRSGVGLNVFGAAGARDDARIGVGGRVEFVMPFGLALGGSYTLHWNSEPDRTAVRPLLGEIGWAIPVVNHLEVRPMVGLGYAFAAGNTSRRNDDPRADNSATVTAFGGGFDVAPGAKVSYVARGFEVYTLPKYHFITGNNFLGVELGAGARF
ncbi:MAG: hypothetical protein HYV09_18745 [Deltaproteobacteria bacterium]|nr:hypothetical protein [Deltaproteobacteria bacterium]